MEDGPSIDFQRLDRLAAAGREPLSSEERWQQIMGMMEFAVRVINASRDAGRIRAYKEAQEPERQKTQRRLFSHASRT